MIEVTGHRGARGLAPENTLAGFRLAADFGCHNIELDVHLTKEGDLAVIHDETIDRTTNGSGPVSSFTMAELKQFDAGEGQRIPSLREVFQLLKDTETNIQIELKGPNTEDPSVELVKKLGFLDRVSFTSFFHSRILRVKNTLPGVTTGILIACNPVKPIELLAQAKADRLHVNQKVIDTEMVEELHRGGKKLAAWGAIVEAPIIDRLIGLCVDIIGSDRPDLVIERLKLFAGPEVQTGTNQGGDGTMVDRT
jgi:glycerophosphoryl diester phosphodiesterase